MESEISSHAIIHIHSYQGQLIVGEKWQTITNDLHTSLKQHGIEDQRSSPTLLQFKFNHPFSALAAVQEALIKIKIDHDWPEEQDPLPIQIVFHMDKTGELTPPIRESSSDIWDALEKEKAYVTNTLKHQWSEVMEGRQIPEHSFKSIGQGLYLLDFKKEWAIKTRKLFQYRDLFLSGEYPVCFYCGQTSHEPLKCPSKLLPLNTLGLDLIGFLSFEEIDSLAPEVFTHPEKLYQLLANGVTPAELRKSPPLILFSGFLDTNLIYQSRFLWQITFSSAPAFQDALNTDSESLTIDSPNMQLGLDSLRVGKLDQATTLFEKELNSQKDENEFYAAVGLAFTHLEKNEDKYVEHYLNKASDHAILEKEILYIKLLQARFLNLKEKLWEADQEIKIAISTDRSCYEARYARIRVAVKSGFGEKSISDLKRLTDSQQELFMTALLDPELKPIQGLIEEMLFTIAHSKAQGAARNLNDARNECQELSEWLSPEDKNLNNNKNTLARLEKLYASESFYGLLEVEGRSEGLKYNCQRIREELNSNVKSKLNRAYSIFVSCEKFWDNYPYQSFFSNFAAGLESTKSKMIQVDKLLGKYTGASFKEARESLIASQKELVNLRKSISRMVSLENFIALSRSFIRYLMISEVSTILAVTIVLMIFNSQAGSGITSNSGLFKQALTITALFIAPMLALGLTIKNSK